MEGLAASNGLSVPSGCSSGSNYWAARESYADGTRRWVIEQGIEMGRPSRLEVEADKAGGKVSAVRVGGASVMISKGTISVP